MSLQYKLTRACVDNIAKVNNNSLKVIKANCRYFSSWCKDNGYNKIEKIQAEGEEQVLQKYCDYLVERHLSPATVHTYLSSPCKALGVSMEQIDKPKRISDTITRSRDQGKNRQGKIDMEQPYYKRLIEFQKAVGLRRHELANLKGKNLIKDESGKLSIEVFRGKGGKYQLQRILPEDMQIVKDTFRNIAPDEFLFSSTELKNKIDLHSLRAEHARKCYVYYSNMDREETKQLISELVARYLRFNNNNVYKCKNWLKELYKSNGEYILRGANYDRAVISGRPVKYNRIALMAVSVFHLSHWRLGVTVINYMI